MRAREDAELVAQGKSHEQEVYTRCRTARAVAALKPPRITCRVPSGDPNVKVFAGRDIGESQRCRKTEADSAR